MKWLRDNWLLPTILALLMVIGILVISIVNGGDDSSEPGVNESSTTVATAPETDETTPPNTVEPEGPVGGDFEAHGPHAHAHADPCSPEHEEFVSQVSGFTEWFFGFDPELSGEERIEKLEPFVTEKLLALYADRFEQEETLASQTSTVTEVTLIGCDNLFLEIYPGEQSAYSMATLRLHRFEGDVTYIDETLAIESWWINNNGSWLCDETRTGAKVI